MIIHGFATKLKDIEFPETSRTRVKILNYLYGYIFLFGFSWFQPTALPPRD